MFLVCLVLGLWAFVLVVFLCLVTFLIFICQTWTCAKRWAEIPYSLVPSRSMDLHKDEFMKHDHDRFVAYLDAMKTGKSTIKGIE